MMRIVLLRHGRTEGNERMLYYGSTDVPLSLGGREELHTLRAAGGYPDIAGMRVYTSGMRRTEETLDILYGAVPHAAVPAMRELDFGDFEMHTYEELKDDPRFVAWCQGDNERNVTPGGESGEQADRRALAGFEELLRRGEDFLLVCHAGPISAIMSRLFPRKEKNRFYWLPDNGRGYLLTLEDGKWTWVPVPAGGEDHG